MSLVFPWELYSTAPKTQVKGWVAYTIGEEPELPPFSPEQAEIDELTLLVQIRAWRSHSEF